MNVLTILPDTALAELPSNAMFMDLAYHYRKKMVNYASIVVSVIQVKRNDFI